jgi:hypothetical protein
MHVDREGTFDGHLGVFNLGGVLVISHTTGCDDVARGTCRLSLDQLEEEDLWVNALPHGTLDIDRPACRWSSHIARDA